MKRTPLKRVSAKNAAKERELAAARKHVIWRSYGRCEVRTPDCDDREHAGNHVHHVKTRAMGGTHDPDNLLHVCSPAHDWIHSHPVEAVDKGWLGSRYSS